MITRQHTQESLCCAFVTAVAGMAGVNYHFGAAYDYGVDCQIRHVKVNLARSRRVESGIAIDLQLKSTIDWQHDGDAVVYDLEAKTWNDMVGRDPAAIPLYLGLMCLPRSDIGWLSCREDYTVLQKCCYYLRASGEPETSNTRTRRVRIPRSNLLTASNLRGLIDEARDAIGRHA